MGSVLKTFMLFYCTLESATPSNFCRPATPTGSLLFAAPRPERPSDPANPGWEASRLGAAARVGAASACLQVTRTAGHGPATVAWPADRIRAAVRTPGRAALARRHGGPHHSLTDYEMWALAARRCQRRGAPPRTAPPARQQARQPPSCRLLGSDHLGAGLRTVPAPARRVGLGSGPGWVTAVCVMLHCDDSDQSTRQPPRGAAGRQRRLV